MRCFRKIGITDACIKSFAKQNTSEDKNKIVSEDPARLSDDCIKWQAEHKDGTEINNCVAAAKNSISTRDFPWLGPANCPAWIANELNYCYLPPITLIAPVCICSVLLAYGCPHCDCDYCDTF